MARRSWSRRNPPTRRRSPWTTAYTPHPEKRAHGGLFSLGATPWEILRRVALPASLPHVFTGVRLAWGVALIVIIASEMIGSVSGLGYMVLTAQQTFRVERVFAGIIIIGVLGFATDQGMRALQRWLVPWSREARNRP